MELNHKKCTINIIMNLILLLTKLIHFKSKGLLQVNTFRQRGSVDKNVGEFM